MASTLQNPLGKEFLDEAVDFLNKKKIPHKVTVEKTAGEFRGFIYTRYKNAEIPHQNVLSDDGDLRMFKIIFEKARSKDYSPV